MTDPAPSGAASIADAAAREQIERMEKAISRVESLMLVADEDEARNQATYEWQTGHVDGAMSARSRLLYAPRGKLARRRNKTQSAVASLLDSVQVVEQTELERLTAAGEIIGSGFLMDGVPVPVGRAGDAAQIVERTRGAGAGASSSGINTDAPPSLDLSNWNKSSSAPTSTSSGATTKKTRGFVARRRAEVASPAARGGGGSGGDNGEADGDGEADSDGDDAAIPMPRLDLVNDPTALMAGMAVKRGRRKIPRTLVDPLLGEDFRIDRTDPDDQKLMAKLQELQRQIERQRPRVSTAILAREGEAALQHGEMRLASWCYKRCLKITEKTWPGSANEGAALNNYGLVLKLKSQQPPPPEVPELPPPRLYGDFEDDDKDLDDARGGGGGGGDEDHQQAKAKAAAASSEEGKKTSRTTRKSVPKPVDARELQYDVTVLKEAEQVYVRALTLARKHHGDSHADTAIAMCNLASISRCLGKKKRASRLFKLAAQVDDDLDWYDWLR